jgi:hypothetical protein
MLSGCGSAAFGERLNADGAAHKGEHLRQADGKEHGLEDVDAVVAQTEQDGERPSAGKRGAVLERNRRWAWSARCWSG